jgi:hypothetical protein
MAKSKYVTKLDPEAKYFAKFDATSKYVTKLKKSIKEWNAWREANPGIVPDLSELNYNLRLEVLIEADLGGADLSAVNLKRTALSGANLRRANLRGANLSGAFLGSANLSEANLSGANLTLADLSWADLRGADLGWADLSQALGNGANLSAANLLYTNLSGAHLDGADFSAARLFETVFGNTNLKKVQGLDACVHHGPSSIDYRTLATSGSLPPAFLRGCGLPDEFIEYLPSPFNQAIQFYSCFISYSTQDQAFAERLHADLQNKNVRCWFAPHDIQGGKKIHEQIDEAIRFYDRLLLILSEASMNSEWVKTEIANARQKELAQGGRVLFPITLVPFETVKKWKNFDPDTGTDSAREIREYYIRDFSDWKSHDKYQDAFERLIKDLRTEERKST